MGLYSALNAAVSGLKAQSNALSVISTNIANASTTGYKTEEVNFDSLVAGSADSESNNNLYGGTGVSTQVFQDMSTIGNISSTSTSTNMAIDGSGFFVVTSDPTNTSTASDLYTRDGTFSQNAKGYLVNSSGDYLLGYATNADGTTTSASVGQLSALTPVVIPPTTAAVPTTTATLSANLPAGLATASTATSSNPDYVTSALTAIDSLGETQTVNETWTNDGNNTWTLSLSGPTDASGNVGTVSPSSVTLAFNSDGTLQSLTPQGGTTSTSGSLSIQIGGSGGATTQLASGAASSTITLDLSGMTQYASTSSTNAISISTNTTNGSTAGTLSSISVSTSGMVSAKYSNGSTVDVAQVPVATFADQAGLTEITGSTYSANQQTGNATLVTAGKDGAGTITGSALEASTTDTSTEFDKMIQAQQAYSAAAQVVTYVDKMFNTLIQSIG